MLFIEILVRFFEGMCGQKDAMLEAYFYRFHSTASVVPSAIFGLIQSSILESCQGSSSVSCECICVLVACYWLCEMMNIVGMFLQQLLVLVLLVGF
jgi:hypothetical protein